MLSIGRLQLKLSSREAAASRLDLPLVVPRGRTRSPASQPAPLPASPPPVARALPRRSRRRRKPARLGPRPLLKSRAPTSLGSPPLSEELTRRLRTSQGRPLGRQRGFFEGHFGRDLSAVRIHADAIAAEAAEALGARAFTLGEDIYFGSGQFAPHTSEGRALLGHELAHVVQAYEGIIPRQTSRTGTLPIGNARHLESFAEEHERRLRGLGVPGWAPSRILAVSLAGDLGAQRRRAAEVVNAARARAEERLDAICPPGASLLLDKVKVSAAIDLQAPGASEQLADEIVRQVQLQLAGRGSGSASLRAGARVIQRAVGFEFEVTNYEVTDKQGRRLKKKTPITRGRGFELQAEDKGDDVSCIEFVTNPPGYQTLQDLVLSMSDMAGVAESVESWGRTKGTFNAALPGVRGDANYTLHRKGNFDAHVQASVGVPLDSIPALFRGLEQMGAPGNYNYPRVLGQRAAEVARRYHLGQAPSRKLVGLLTLLNSYLLAGRPTQKRSFAKGLFEVMARTDFKTMFNMLPRDEREYYRRHLVDWVELGVSAQQLDPMDRVMNQSFSYEDDFLINPAKHGEQIDLSRAHWLGAMPHMDLLREDMHELIEAMGGLRSKVDNLAVYRQDRLSLLQAPVFELRNLPAPPQAPYDWQGYARRIWDLVQTAVEHPYDEPYAPHADPHLPGLDHILATDRRALQALGRPVAGLVLPV